MTSNAGAGRFAARTSGASVDSVPSTIRSVGNVACEITAAGVLGARPLAIAVASVSSSRANPM